MVDDAELLRRYAHDRSEQAFTELVELSAEQATQLTQILANASGNYQAGKMAVRPSVDWDTALARAQGILSEPQLASLKTIIASYQQSQIYSKLAQITLRGN